MSRRREARGRPNALNLPSGDVPAALAVGCCIDVWSEDGRSASMSAWSRFGVARDVWAAEHGLSYDVEQSGFWSHMPWSVAYLGFPGHAEHIGLPLAEIVADWLNEGGCTIADLPRLRREAADLYARAQRTKEKI